MLKIYGNIAWGSNYTFIQKNIIDTKKYVLHLTHNKEKYEYKQEILRLNKILNVYLSIKYLNHRVLNVIFMRVWTF